MIEYEKTKNQFEGILIKSTDMQFALKSQIAKLIADAIKKFGQHCDSLHHISERVVRFLEDKYRGAWICVIGKKLTVNITHEPGFFMRANTEEYHIIVFKIRYLHLRNMKLSENQKESDEHSFSRESSF